MPEKNLPTPFPNGPSPGCDTPVAAPEFDR
jgi:hypothetical protein